MSDAADRYFTELMAAVAETTPEPPEWPGEPVQPVAPVGRPVAGWAVATAVAFVGVLVFVGLTALLVRDGGDDVAATSLAVSIPTGDGVALRGDLWEGSDVAVLVVGAYGAAEGELHPITEALALRGFTVLTYDPRGQGQSGGSVEPHLLDEDVNSAVAYLRGQTDAVYVVGYRHSGAAALAAAGAGRLDVDGLIGLFPMDRYLEQDALGAMARLQTPLMLIGASNEMVAAAPDGTEFRSLAPVPEIFTKSGPRIAELVEEFITSAGS